MGCSPLSPMSREVVRQPCQPLMSLVSDALAPSGTAHAAGQRVQRGVMNVPSSMFLIKTERVATAFSISNSSLSEL